MFREYDIRGRENDEELNDLTIAFITLAFGTMLKQRDIATAIVGSDARASSGRFHQIAITNLNAAGIKVIDIGTVTTPMSYWAQYYFNTLGLVMITASHNPAGWNGLKLGTGLSKTLLQEEISELYKITKDLLEKKIIPQGVRSVQKEAILDA